VKDLQLRGVAYISVWALVYGSNQEPIPGARVTAGKYSGTTNENGQAYLEVEYGTYTVVVSAEGYQTYTYSLGRIGKGAEATVKIPLKKAGSDASSMLMIALVLIIVVVVAAAGAGGYMYKKKKKAKVPAPAPVTAQPVTPPPPSGPSEEEKKAEWESYKKLYGRPHPGSPEGESAAAAGSAAPPTEPPADAVTGEPPAPPPGGPAP